MHLVPHCLAGSWRASTTPSTFTTLQIGYIADKAAVLHHLILCREMAGKYNIKYFYDITDRSNFKANPDYKGVCHVALAQVRQHVTWHCYIVAFAAQFVAFAAQFWALQL
jgi:hypothetical protein